MCDHLRGIVSQMESQCNQSHSTSGLSFKEFVLDRRQGKRYDRYQKCYQMTAKYIEII